MFMLVVLSLTLLAPAYGSQMCMDCRDTPHPQDCSKVIQCGPTETCFVEQFVSPGGILLYNSGCIAKDRCRIRKRRSFLEVVAKRQDTNDVTTCIQCCSGDFCNLEGCGQVYVDRTQRGPICFHCDAQADPEHCRDVRQCNSRDQVCMLTRNFNYSPDVVLKSTCIERAACKVIASLPLMVGKRSTGLCTKCCEDDFCNHSCRTSIVATTHAVKTTPPTVSTTHAVTPTKTTHKTTHAPATHKVTQPLTTHKTTHAPATHKVTQAPTTHKTTHAPATHKVTQALTTHKTTHAPATHKVTQPPTTHKTTHAPATHKVTQAPTTHKTTHAPATHKVTQAPTTHKTTHAPATHKVTQAPTTHKTTHAPATHKVTQAPTTHKTTHAPATHKVTQAPTTHKATQAPKTTHMTTKIPATHKTTTAPTTVPPTTPTTSDPAEACRSDNYQYDARYGLCLKFHTQKLNWTNAEKVCQSERGTLALVTSATKLTEIKKTIHLFPAFRSETFWVGASDHGNNPFHWNNGQPVLLSSDQLATMKDSKCISVMESSASSFEPLPCSDKYAFICERQKSIH